MMMMVDDNSGDGRHIDGAPYDLPYSRKLPPYRSKLLIDLYNYCTILSSLFSI
jgi:hypothetical protein